MSAPILLLAVAIVLAGWREGSHQTGAHHLMTVVQQDRFAGPFDRPSARVSARGLHVVFSSYARLVVTDTNQLRDVYVLDLSTGQLTLESVGRNGSVANGDSGSPDISGDGRYVVFVWSAGNLADTQMTAGVPRVFLRDRENATTRLLTTSASGGPANGYSNNPAISADGTTVVFESAATDLLQSDAPNDVSVYLMRLSSSERTRLNVSSASEPRAGQSVSPSISANGRYIAFMSKADLTCRDAPACVREPPDRNRVADVYVRDALTNTTGHWRKAAVFQTGIIAKSPAPEKFAGFASACATYTCRRAVRWPRG